MRFKTILSLSLLAGALLLASCSEDTRTTRNLYDDWWPVHAAGSQENELFTARWDGDLSHYGGIEVTFVEKNNPSRTYTQFIYYKALSFKSDHKTFSYISISTRDYTSSKALKFYIKDKKIYFEKMNEAGRGSGEYEEGKPISFVDDDHVKIDNVTYERYSVYYEKHRNYPDHSDMIRTEIPVMIYE